MTNLKELKKQGKAFVEKEGEKLILKNITTDELLSVFSDIMFLHENMKHLEIVGPITIGEWSISDVLGSMWEFPNLMLLSLCDIKLSKEDVEVFNKDLFKYSLLEKVVVFEKGVEKQCINVNCLEGVDLSEKATLDKEYDIEQKRLYKKLYKNEINKQNRKKYGISKNHVSAMSSLFEKLGKKNGKPKAGAINNPNNVDFGNFSKTRNTIGNLERGGEKKTERVGSSFNKNTKLSF